MGFKTRRYNFLDVEPELVRLVMRRAKEGNIATAQQAPASVSALIAAAVYVAVEHRPYGMLKADMVKWFESCAQEACEHVNGYSEEEE